MAKNIFQYMGINLEKDDFNLKVLTSAGYALLNGQATDVHNFSKCFYIYHIVTCKMTPITKVYKPEK